MQDFIDARPIIRRYERCNLLVSRQAGAFPARPGTVFARNRRCLSCAHRSSQSRHQCRCPARCRACAQPRPTNWTGSRQAGGSGDPLHGVPITIKDSLDTEGIVSTGGTLGRRDYVPSQDAPVVARLRAAGAVLLGKTNTPELTLSGETNNLIYGRTCNPFDTRRSPGGSSGGSAAIIACAGSALELGSDTGGSIREPAHLCGIAGIKPTSGRTSRSGHIVPYGGVMIR